MLALTRAIGVLIIAVMVAWLLLAVLRGRLHPVGGLGVALGVTVLLFPVVQPWYLLWAIIPLAAWATRPGFRVAAIVVTLVVGHLRPDRQRRPVRAVPDRRRHAGQHGRSSSLLIALTYTACRGADCSAEERERRRRRRPDPAPPTATTPPAEPLPGRLR